MTADEAVLILNLKEVSPWVVGGDKVVADPIK